MIAGLVAGIAGRPVVSTPARAVAAAARAALVRMLPAADDAPFLAADLAEEFDAAGRDRGRRGGASLVLEAGLSLRAAARAAACSTTLISSRMMSAAPDRTRGENLHAPEFGHRSAVRVADEPAGSGRHDLGHACHRAGHRRDHRDLQRDGGRVPPSAAVPRARSAGALQHDGRESRTRAGGELPRRAGLAGSVDAPRSDRLYDVEPGTVRVGDDAPPFSATADARHRGGDPGARHPAADRTRAAAGGVPASARRRP